MEQVSNCNKIAREVLVLAEDSLVSCHGSFELRNQDWLVDLLAEHAVSYPLQYYAQGFVFAAYGWNFFSYPSLTSCMWVE